MSQIKNNINIIATVGPSSMDEKIIKKMDKSGINVFRINLSHTNISELKEKIKKLQSWTNKDIAIDTEGAQLRTDDLMDGLQNIELKSHQNIEIVGTDNYSQKNQIPINQKSITKILKNNDLLKIDFDNVIVRITNIVDNVAFAKVVEGGIVYSNKGISVDRSINLDSFTKKDLEAIKIANECKLKTIFLSFCTKGEDVIYLRKKLNKGTQVISKVESESGLINLDSICSESDAILIDRGDLSRDVALEKISFAQNYIIDKSKENHTPVYVATNLMENMIEYNNPTRAEINDISNLVQSGVSGLVLAAETAIGKNPIKCTRVLKSIINECISNDSNQKLKSKDNLLKYLLLPPNNGLIPPHGGNLIQQFYNGHLDEIEQDIAEIYVDENYILDIKQISNGVYSPLSKFMNLNEIEYVVYKNKLKDDTPWTIPITFNINKEQMQELPSQGQILIKSLRTKEKIALMQIDSVEKIKNKDELAKNLFGTNDLSHPGVEKFINQPDYIISGSPFIISNNFELSTSDYNLMPRQVREIFYYKNWQNIVGFHTRNIPHKGHEFIQKKALELSNADAIFISPVTGSKKKGDFKSKVIFDSYEQLISKNFYNPFGAILSAFSTYSRYAGPREAVFTAICRKNYGCNNFIIGRDHTGVGDYYKPEASSNIFKEIDIGINILSFDTAYYSKKSAQITDLINNNKTDKIQISGTKIRQAVIKNDNLPEYMIRKDILDMIRKAYLDHPDEVFH